jgi:hypothetical protein
MSRVESRSALLCSAGAFGFVGLAACWWWWSLLILISQLDGHDPPRYIYTPMYEYTIHEGESETNFFIIIIFHLLFFLGITIPFFHLDSKSVGNEMSIQASKRSDALI